MKTVIITGASQGLGAQLSKYLDSKNTHLILIARDLEKLKKVSEGIEFAKASLIACALENELQLNSLLADFSLSKSSEIVLINNAATWTGGKLVKNISSDFMRRSFELNFMSAFNILKFVLSHRAEGQLTKVINIGATASKRGSQNTSAFAVAKSSLRILTQSLAREMAPENVHACSIIVDGLIENDRTKELNPNKSGGYISMDSLCNIIKSVLDQPKDCWTLELDVRPNVEKF